VAFADVLYFVFVTESGVGVVVDGLTFPEEGVYMNSAFLDVTESATLVIPNYIGFPDVKTLDPIYLPKHSHTIDEVGGGVGFEH
jgi:hypothetical protein